MFVMRSTYDKLMGDNISLMSEKTMLEVEVVGLRGEHVTVLQKYTDLLRENIDVKSELSNLRSRWNDLIGRINDKGGEEFLDGELPGPEFTEREIRTLISLCHPDKHSGKKSATDITAKLLDMKGRAGC